MGPSAEADAEFEKELAKMRMGTSAEARKVDRKTALALWDSAALPTSIKKKRASDFEGDGDAPASTEEPVMNFTLVTKRGKQQQVSSYLWNHLLSLFIETIQTRKIAVPAESALAIQTRTAQMQDRVEQQQLKRLVLNYEQREEAEELKGMTQFIAKSCPNPFPQRWRHKADPLRSDSRGDIIRLHHLD